jgi:hypothetical protein
VNNQHQPIALYIPTSLSDEATAQLIHLFHELALRLEEHQYAQHLHALDADERQHQLFDNLDDEGPPF